MSASLIMAAVAILCAALALIIFKLPTPSEAAVYRARVAATMLGAAALILAFYAFALHRWDAPV